MKILKILTLKFSIKVSDFLVFHFVGIITSDKAFSYV